MEKNNLTIIIPTFNGLLLLKNNLPKVIDVSEGAAILVVDDGSTDGTGAWIRRNYPNIDFFSMEKNQGFAKAVNLGVFKAKTEIVVLLNNDAVPQRGWLSALEKNFENPDVFGVGCLEISKSGSKIVESGRSIGKFDRGLLVHSRGTNAPYSLWATGGSAAFGRAKWLKLRGMDTIYAPFYWEDIDLSYRGWKQGWKVKFEPEAVVVHNHEQTIGKYYSNQEIKTISIKNQYLFVWKNVTDIDLIVQHLYWLPVQLFLALLRADSSYLRGFLWALAYAPRLLWNRVMGETKMIVSDKEVIKLQQTQEL